MNAKNAKKSNEKQPTLPTDEELISMLQYAAERFAAIWLGSNDEHLIKDVAQAAVVQMLEEQFSRLDTARPIHVYARRTVMRVFSRAANRPRHRAKLMPLTAAAHATSNEPDPSAFVQQLQTSSQVQQALRQLSEKLRMPVILHYFDGLSTLEVGSALKIPTETVRVRLYRARRRLRIILKHLR